MAVTSGFFNSVDGDRKYRAEDFAAIFDGIVEDGIYKGVGTNFAATATGGLNVSVGVGRAWFNRTWTYNDAPYPLGFAASHPSQPRIDSIVLEVDTSDAVRRNRIFVLEGTAAGSPTPPSMLHTETINQYPLHNVLRPANSTVITQGNITPLIGTPQAPYAVNRLLDRQTEPSAMHRNVFRGKYLGSSYTSGQKSAIADGSFEDLYIGDYWTIAGVNWRIVDINYYIGKGEDGTPDRRITTNHILVMPDTTLRSGRMNEDFFKANSGGYKSASARTNHLPPMKSTIESAFGSAYLMEWRQVITNSVSSGIANNAEWISTSVDLPNTIMITGQTLYIPGSNGNNLPPTYGTESNTQLALFRLVPKYITAANVSGSRDDRCYWLRDVLSPAVWGAMTAESYQYYRTSDSQIGFRPIFALKG